MAPSSALAPVANAGTTFDERVLTITREGKEQWRRWEAVVRDSTPPRQHTQWLPHLQG